MYIMSHILNQDRILNVEGRDTMMPEVYKFGGYKESLLIEDAVNSGMTTAREV